MQFSLTHDLSAWVDARIQAAVAGAVPTLVAALLANEAKLLVPVTDYLDGKIGQLEQTLEQSLPAMITAAIQAVIPHWFEPAPPGWTAGWAPTEEK